MNISKSCTACNYAIYRVAKRVAKDERLSLDAINPDSAALLGMSSTTEGSAYVRRKNL